MNWRIIFQLSLFGLVMAFATVYLIPSNIEPLFWLIIFIICAVIIAKKAAGKYFMHGFMVSIFNSIWITTIHILLYSAYIANHHDMHEMLSLNNPFPGHPRIFMAVSGIVIGILSGLVLGLFSFIASKLIKKNNSVNL